MLASTTRDWTSRAQRLTDTAPTSRVILSDEVKYYSVASKLKVNHTGFSNNMVDGAMQVFLDGHGAWKSDFAPLIWVGADANHDAAHITEFLLFGYWWW